MKLKNTTEWPDWFLRRMVAWCCRELGCSTAIIREAVFRNRKDRYTSGHAWWGGKRGRFVVSSGLKSPVRLVELIKVTGHEVFHLKADQDGIRSRRFGRSSGSSEHQTEWHERRIYEAFEANRESLLAEWNEPPAARAKKPKPSIVEQRAAKVQADLDRWTRKLKLAQTKCKKLKAKARYYERSAAVSNPGE